MFQFCYRFIFAWRCRRFLHCLSYLSSNETNIPQKYISNVSYPDPYQYDWKGMVWQKCLTVCKEAFQAVSAFVMDLQLTVIYISSEAKSNLSDVTKDLKEVIDVNLPQLILGDFNFHHEETNCLTTFLKGLGLFQVVPNWQNTKGSSNALNSI